MKDHQNNIEPTEIDDGDVSYIPELNQDYNYKNQPFPWKLTKLCENPHAFFDFKRRNMRIGNYRF
jgi:hypothetical protein